MFIITKEYVIFLEELIIASKVPVTELHVTESVHGTPFQELILSLDFKSKTEQRN